METVSRDFHEHPDVERREFGDSLHNLATDRPAAIRTVTGEVIAMGLFRLYTGDDQQSHLEESKMPFAPGQFAEQAPPQPATGVVFTRVAPAALSDWHNAPRRQYVIRLGGAVGIGLGDGTVRRFGPADVVLAEDLTGKGHTTRAIGSEPWLMMIVPLKE